MIKKKLLFVWAVIFAVVSCKMEIPEKISIKTDAEYAFYMGNFEKSFSDFFSVESLKKVMREKSNTVKSNIDDYNPEGKSEVQQYLLSFPIEEIPIDVGKYFSDMNFSEKLKEISFEKKISIPNFEKKVIENEIDMPNFNTQLKEKLRIDLPEISLPEGLNSSLPNPISENITITEPDFEYIKFESGEIVITPDLVSGLPSLDFSTDLTFSLYYEGNVVSSVSNVNLASGESFSLPVSGKNIHRIMNLEINGSLKGGVLGKTNKYRFSQKLSEDSKLGSVYRLNMDLEDAGKIPINQKVDLAGSEDSNFLGCEVAEGYISFEIPFPEGWEGIKCSPEFYLSGALSASSSEFDSSNESSSYILNKYLNLKDKTILGKEITAEGMLTFSLENAVIDFTGNKENKIKSEFEITKIKSLTVDLSENKDNFTAEHITPLPNDLKTYIKSLTLEPSGIKTVFTNDLPAGNDIKLTVKSNFFAINETKEINAGAVEQNIDFLNEAGYVIKPAENDDIDFNIKLGLPGADETSPYHAKFTNIELNKEYSIALKIQPVFDWQKITVDSANVIPLQNNIDTGLQLSSIFEEIDKNFQNKITDRLGLAELPIYLYCSKPDLLNFEDFEFSGKIQLQRGNKKIELLKENAVLRLNNFYELDKDDKGTVISDLENKPYSAKADLSSLLDGSDDSGTIKVDFSIKAHGSGNSGDIEITKEDYESLKNDGKKTHSSLAIYARVIIPLKFSIKEKIEIDMLKAAGYASDKDIFQRTSASDILKDKEQYINAIESVKLIYEGGNKLICYENETDSVEIIFDTKLQDNENNDIKYNLKINNGSLEVKADDLIKMIETYPFCPSVSLYLPEGNLILPRNSKMDLNLAMQVHTNGAIDIFDRNKVGK